MPSFNQPYAGNPAKANNLDSFLAVGKQVPITYTKFCFLNRDEFGVIRQIYNILDDYSEEIRQYVEHVNLTFKDIARYYMKPKLMAYDIYLSTDLYPIILWLNRMSNVKEFTLKRRSIDLIRRETLLNILNTIIDSEDKMLRIYNMSNAQYTK